MFWRNLLKASVTLTLLAVFALSALPVARQSVSLLVWFGHPLHLNGPTEAEMAASGSPALNLFAFVRENTPKDAVFLVMRQMDFALYAQRRMLRDVDPRMIPVYQAPTVAEAAARLREMGISYIFQPSYALATHANSILAPLLADPAHTALIFDREGFRLYRLLDSEQTYRMGPTMEPLAVRWALDPLCGLNDPRWSVSEDSVTLRSTLLSAFVVSECGDEYEPPTVSGPGRPVVGGAVYRVEGSLDGKGTASLQVLFYDEDGNSSRETVWQSVLTGTGERRFAAMFRAPAKSRQIRFGLAATAGYRQITLRDLRVEAIERPSAEPPPIIRPPAPEGRKLTVPLTANVYSNPMLNCGENSQPSPQSLALSWIAQKLKVRWNRFIYLLHLSPDQMQKLVVTGTMTSLGPVSLAIGYNAPGTGKPAMITIPAKVYGSPDGTPFEIRTIIDPWIVPRCVFVASSTRWPVQIDSLVVRRVSESDGTH